MTYEGNILQVRLRPEPQVVVVVMDQPFNNEHMSDVVSYLIPADDHHQHRGMLLVRHYTSLEHLSNMERRNIKRRKKREVIRVQSLYMPERWQLIQVLEVDLARKTLTRLEDIGRHHALFIGQLACFSLSTDSFSSVPGNALYIGTNGSGSSYFGVCYLGDMSIDPPFEFITTDVRNEGSQQQRKLVPKARPCTIQEYLVCCTGIKGGIED